MRYAAIGPDGRALGFYDDAIHADIPEGATPITEAVWAEWVEHTATRLWDAASATLIACEPARPSITLDGICDLIDRERDRRIEAGIEFPPGGGRIIQTRQADQDNIAQQMLRATTLIATGREAEWGAGRVWLDASNVDPLSLPTAQDMIDLGTAVGDWKERHIFRAHAHKALYRAGGALVSEAHADAPWLDDAHWPAR